MTRSDWPGDLARWDALSDGLRERWGGGLRRRPTATGRCPEQWRATLLTVLRQRLGAHEHPEAVADALRAVPRSRPFETRERARARSPRRRWSSPTATSPTPATRWPSARRTPRSIPGARLVVEEEGKSPIAWQGGQLSKVIAGCRGGGGRLGVSAGS